MHLVCLDYVPMKSHFQHHLNIVARVKEVYRQCIMEWLRNYLIYLKMETNRFMMNAPSIQNCHSWWYYITLKSCASWWKSNDHGHWIVAWCLQTSAYIPTSNYYAKKLLNKIVLHYTKIHACPKDCMLYWRGRCK